MLLLLDIVETMKTLVNLSDGVSIAVPAHERCEAILTGRCQFGVSYPLL